MKETSALVWKEWRQNRVFLFAGLALFLGLPSIQVLMRWLRGAGGWFYSDMLEDMVLLFGGLLAIIVGANTACQELGSGLESFWRSRPARLKRWMTVKYLAGLVTVLGVCCFTLVVQLVLIAFFYTHPNFRAKSAVGLLFCNSFTLILIYSVSFLLGVAVRRKVNACILSTGALLLIYFLPIILPPLGWASVYGIMVEMRTGRFGEYGMRYVVFVFSMLVCSGIAVWLSYSALKANWLLVSDRRVLCWAKVAVVFLLFGSAAFELGNNMDCERRVSLPAVGFVGVWDFAVDGDRGVVLYTDGPDRGSMRDRKYFLGEFDLSAGTDELGRTVMVGVSGRSGNTQYELRNVFWSSKHPSRAYVLRIGRERATGLKARGLSLLTVSLDSPDEPIIAELDLFGHMGNFRSRYYYPPACMQGENIYVYGGEKLITVDIQSDGAVRLKDVRDVGKIGIHEGHAVSLDSGFVDVNVPTLPDLSFSERLDLAVKLTQNHHVYADIDGDMLVTVGLDWTRQTLRTYRLADRDLANGRAKFEVVGERNATALERFVKLPLATSNIMLRNGKVYRAGGLGLTVYNVRDPETPRRIGHYAAGERFWRIAELSGGRVLVGEKNLHVVASPIER